MTIASIFKKTKISIEIYLLEFLFYFLDNFFLYNIGVSKLFSTSIQCILLLQKSVINYY